MNLRDIQKVSLDIVKDIHSFCINNNIRYSLAYGSLIGAIRHKGFIPWDDDMDILMPRPDYERFIKTYISSDGYMVIPEGDDSMIAMARVCDMKRTKVLQHLSPWCTKDVGVWIDVFPLDGAEDDFQLFKRRADEIYNLWEKNLKYRASVASFSSSKGIIFNIKLFIKKILWRNYNTSLKHIELLKSIPFGTTAFVTNLASPCYRTKEYFKIEYFDEYIEVPFEDTTFLAIKEYDKFLTTIYGDYMKLPPLEVQFSKHSFHKYYWK